MRVTRRHFLRLLGGAAGAVASRAHFGGAGVWGAPADASLLIIGTNFRTVNLDPARSIANSTLTYLHAMYDSLVTVGGDDLQRPRPSLATEWTVSPDGKAYTFRLRPGVRFASGNPLTSADVKWSLERVMHLGDVTRFFVAGVEEVQAPDPLTAVIRLTAPQPAIIPILASASLGALDSKSAIANGGDAGPEAKTKDGLEPYLNRHSLGSGPFILERYLPNEEVVLVKNPRHWRAAAKIDRIVARNIPEAASEQFQIERGDLDIASGIGPEQAQALRHARGVSVKTSPLAGIFHVVMNNDPAIGGPFALPKIQQAVRYGLDYEGIMRIAGPGTIRTAGILPTTFAGCLDPSHAVKTDRTKARALVKEATVGEVRGRLTYSAGLTIWGVPLGLLVQKIQGDLADIGIQIDLNGVAHLTAMQQYRDGKSQIGVWYWVADWADESDFLVYLPGRDVGRRCGWLADSTPEAAALARLGHEAESDLDPQRRAALYRRIDRQLRDIGPYVPLFQPAVPYAVRTDVSGATYNGLGVLDLYPISKRG